MLLDIWADTVGADAANVDIKESDLRSTIASPPNFHIDSFPVMCKRVFKDQSYRFVTKLLVRLCTRESGETRRQRECLP
jgi:hypothetical protein